MPDTAVADAAGQGSDIATNSLLAPCALEAPVGALAFQSCDLQSAQSLESAAETRSAGLAFNGVITGGRHQSLPLAGEVTACIEADFGAVYAALAVRVWARHTERACGDSCWRDRCGTAPPMVVLGSSLPYSSGGTASMELLGPSAALGPTIEIHTFAPSAPLRYVMVCRGHPAAEKDVDNILVDFVAIELPGGETPIDCPSA